MKTTNQYFNENPAALTHERTLKLNIFDIDFSFLANNGLFSCDKVDAASITLLENILPLTGHLLDLGCGYGTIGIVLARINDVILTMSDINRIALQYAAKNAVANGVEAACIHSDGFDNLEGMYDNVVLNPPIHAGKEVMYKLYSGAGAHLVPGGALYIVIHKKHGAESSLEVLKGIYAECTTLYKKKGLYVFRCVTKTEGCL
ncbi:MAG: methyltransferase [Defluviitaleaceae bacterium]|nr:methyltransferase [Defluviitaleaceae bacterium]